MNKITCRHCGGEDDEDEMNKISAGDETDYLCEHCYDDLNTVNGRT